MSRRYVWPRGSWSWPIKLSHMKGLKCGEMIFVSGQADIDIAGNTMCPGDLAAQTEAVMDHVVTVLEELDADLEDVVKLVVFYVERGEGVERALLGQLGRRFAGAVAPAVMPVPLPALAYPGMMVEIEAIAMRGQDGARMARTAAAPADHWDWPFSHGVRCGEMIFVGAQMPLDAGGGVRAPGDPVAQARINIENLGRVLAELGAELDDVCRLNTFYVGYGTTADWSQAAQVRGNAFTWPGPVGTGVPVPALYPDGLTITQEAVAMRGTDGAKLARQAVRPEAHWDWPIPVNFQQGVKVGRMIFVGGQVCQDTKGRVVHPDDMVRQTVITMEAVRRVLEAYGAVFDDVVKVNCFYKGGADYEALHQNLSIRSASFTRPGPTTTGIPLTDLALEGLEIEVEAYAMVEE